LYSPVFSTIFASMQERNFGGLDQFPVQSVSRIVRASRARVNPSICACLCNASEISARLFLCSAQSPSAFVSAVLKNVSVCVGRASNPVAESREKNGELRWLK
jgi:hypothetical protein